MEALHRLERYAPGGMDSDAPTWRREGGIVLYWVIAMVLAFFFARHEVFSFNMLATIKAVWPIVLLTSTLSFSQWLYSQVAINEDRPFNWIGTPIFVIGNSLGETLAFLLVFKAGSLTAAFLLGLVGISGWILSVGSFAGGFLVFLVYGGSIHGLFWMQIFPPHFKDDERARKIRKFRLWSESALSCSWCLTFFVFNDFWMVVLYHAIVDIVLMIRVRPRIFRFNAWFGVRETA